jgi:HEAT repeat protein
MSPSGSPDVQKLKGKRDVDGLLKALEYEKVPNVRAAAALALGELRDTRAVNALIASLKDTKAPVRKNAATALGKIGNESAVEQLILALQDENFTVSTAAATALGEIGDERATEPLMAAMEAESNFLRKAAAKALKQFVGAYEAKSRLETSEKAMTTPEERIARGIKILEELCSDSGIVDEKVYIQRAVEILEPEGVQGSLALVELIEDLLACRSSKLMVILEVAEQLEPSQELIDVVLEIKGASELAPVPGNYKYTAEIVGDGKVGWTGGTASDIWDKTIVVLEKLTGAVVEPAGLVRPGANLAGGDFAEADWDSADLTGTNLRSANLENAILRHTTLKNINLEGANLKGANLYFANLTGANLKGANLREANLYMSVMTDAELEGADVTDAYVEGAVTLPNGLRGGIAELKQFTLGKPQDSEELASAGDVLGLIKSLEYEDDEIRQSAIEALGDIGEPAIESLIEVFRGENMDMYRYAARALGEVGQPALQRLITALTDENHRVRYNAAIALGYIGDTFAINPLSSVLEDDDGMVRGMAASSLAKLGPDAVEPLITALSSENMYTRRVVTEALGNTGNLQAVEPLINCLNHEDPVIRKYAAAGLGKLEDDRAAEPLQQALEDDEEDVRKAAEIALKKIKEQ